MLAISDRNLVSLLETFITKFGNVKKGTYDKTDPTAYMNSHAWLTFPYDPFWEPSEAEIECGYVTPGESIYRIDLNDCTWGITIKISDEDGNVLKTSNGWERFPRIYLDLDKAEFEKSIEDSAEMEPEEVRWFLFNCLDQAEWKNKKSETEIWDYDDLGEDKSLFA